MKKITSREKVLITGATGFVGYFLTSSLSKDYQVFATYRKGGQKNLLIKDNNIHWIESNLESDILNFPSVDYIISSAATHYQSRVYPTPMDMINTNIATIFYLSEYAKKNHVKTIIHFSTVSVHGTIKKNILGECQGVYKPNFYGATKYLGERVLCENLTSLPIKIFRLPGIVGPNYFKCWVGRVYEAAKKGNDILISNPDQIFNNITDVYDLNALVRHCIATNNFQNEVGIYNMGSRNPIKILELVNKIIKDVNSSSNVRIIESNTGAFSINIDKLTLELGFYPSDTEAILDKYILDNAERNFCE
jgi:UDP-glucose 4-epimerase